MYSKVYSVISGTVSMEKSSNSFASASVAVQHSIKVPLKPHLLHLHLRHSNYGGSKTLRFPAPLRC